MDYDSIARDMQCVVREAGSLVRTNLPVKTKRVECKQSVSDMVTETDEAVEKMIKDYVKTKYPDHVFLAEESAGYHDRLGDEPTWIIDPVDGTMNFAKTNPFTCISVGFAVNKVVQVGVVYVPFYDEMFFGMRGKGAFLNDEPISVAKMVHLNEALVNTGFAVSVLQLLKRKEVPQDLRERVEAVSENVRYNFNAVLDNCVDIRRGGASALECCYVACGRLDASFELCNKEWDLAAGSLIVEEAGGYCCQMDGSPMDIGNRNYLVASSKNLANELVSVINPAPCDMRQLDADIDAFKSSLLK